MLRTIINKPNYSLKPRTVEVTDGANGNVYKITRFLGASSTISLISADTHSNLKLAGLNIAATGGVLLGSPQTAVVKETLGSESIEYPVVIKAKNSGLPVNPSINNLLARAAPPEPEPQNFTGSRVNSPTFHCPVTDYDITLHGMGDRPWRIFVASTQNKERGLFVENRGNQRIAFAYRNADGTTSESYMSYQPFAMNEASDPDGTFSLRVRRKGSVCEVFLGTAAISQNNRTLIFYATGILDESTTTYVSVENYYDTQELFTSATLTPTSLVTDRLVLRNSVINTSTGILTTDIDYYLNESGKLRGRIETLGGELLVPTTDYEVISNPSAGTARLRLPAGIPSGKRGSIVKVITTSEKETGLRDDYNVTFPGKTAFGQNVAGLTNVFRSQRTFSNMMQQGYWQNSGENNHYDTYGRGNVGHLDDMGWPLRSGLWYWYPLPDQRNTEVTYVLKWTGGPISISHFAAGLGEGITAIGPITRVDDNTYTWTMTADRALANGLAAPRISFDSIDTANPPKNMTLCLVGDDLSERWLPSFINFLKLLPGRLRFMDDRNVNGELNKLNKPYDWSTRPIQDNGSACTIAVEDMLELCNRSGRPLLYNIPASYAYEDNGLAYFHKELDILYYGIGAVFKSPTFTAPQGMIKEICPEVGNENWNPGFGGKGTYHYLVQKSKAIGLFDPNLTGDVNHANLLLMRNRTQTLLMTELQNRITDWRARTIRVLGLQMSDSDFINITGNSLWDTAKNYVDEMACAPYIPADPNAGAVSADVPDKSPAGICNFLRQFAIDHVAPTLAANVSRTLNAGFTHSIYEVNVAVITLGMTLAQNKALMRSQEFYDLWANDLIPMLVGHGGDIALYSDVGPIWESEQWSFFHIADSDYNKQWDAVLDWSNNNPPV